MYNKLRNILKIALYIIVSITKEYILIIVIINYQIRIKIRIYIENTSFNKIFSKILIFGISKLFPNSGNLKYEIFLISLFNLLF